MELEAYQTFAQLKCSCAARWESWNSFAGCSDGADRRSPKKRGSTCFSSSSASLGSGTVGATPNAPSSSIDGGRPHATRRNALEKLLPGSRSWRPLIDRAGTAGRQSTQCRTWTGWPCVPVLALALPIHWSTASNKDGALIC